MGSILGKLFRVGTWGESHGGAVGAMVDGCPSRLPLSEEDIQGQLDRRRPGQSLLTSPRQEADRVHILSGVFEGRTLGSPILLLVENTDARPGAYEPLKDLYRPSHADYTYEMKYGIRNWQGGGRASARETVGRVAAGAIAEKALRLAEGIEIVAHVRSVGTIEAGTTGGDSSCDLLTLARAQVDATPVRCPDSEAAARMMEAIEAARREGDSIGGVIEAVVRGVPPGLGEPVFGKLEADLGRAILSLPACKGVEIGSGFSGASRRGSQENDAFVAGGIPGSIETRTNRSGGVQGGISNGQPIILRAAFKPTATIHQPQASVNRLGQPVVLEAQGRHDPCVVPRAVPLVESMIALVLMDHWLQQLARAEASRRISRGQTTDPPTGAAGSSRA
jgi:chorismate synthase